MDIKPEDNLVGGMLYKAIAARDNATGVKRFSLGIGFTVIALPFGVVALVEGIARKLFGLLLSIKYNSSEEQSPSFKAMYHACADRPLLAATLSIFLALQATFTSFIFTRRILPEAPEGELSEAVPSADELSETVDPFFESPELYDILEELSPDIAARINDFESIRSELPLVPLLADNLVTLEPIITPLIPKVSALVTQFSKAAQESQVGQLSAEDAAAIVRVGPSEEEQAAQQKLAEKALKIELKSALITYLWNKSTFLEKIDLLGTGLSWSFLFSGDESKLNFTTALPIASKIIKRLKNSSIKFEFPEKKYPELAGAVNDLLEVLADVDDEETTLAMSKLIKQGLSKKTEDPQENLEAAISRLGAQDNEESLMDISARLSAKEVKESQEYLKVAIDKLREDASQNALKHISAAFLAEVLKTHPKRRQLTLFFKALAPHLPLILRNNKDELKLILRSLIEGKFPADLTEIPEHLELTTAVLKILRNLSGTIPKDDFEKCVSVIQSYISPKTEIQTSPVAAVIKLVFQHLPALIESNQADIVSLLRAAKSPYPDAASLGDHPEITRPLLKILKALTETLPQEELIECLEDIKNSMTFKAEDEPNEWDEIAFPPQRVIKLSGLNPALNAPIAAIFKSIFARLPELLEGVGEEEYQKNSKALLNLLIDPSPATMAPVLELIAKRPEAIEDLFTILQSLSRTLDAEELKACIDSVVNTLDLDLGVETSPIAPILKMVLSHLPELLARNREDVLALLRAPSMIPFPKTLEEIVEHPELVKPLFRILKTLSEKLGADEFKECLKALTVPIDLGFSAVFVSLFKMLSSKLSAMLEDNYEASAQLLLQAFTALKAANALRRVTQLGDHPEITKPLFEVLKALTETLPQRELIEYLESIRTSMTYNAQGAPNEGDELSGAPRRAIELSGLNRALNAPVAAIFKSIFARLPELLDVENEVEYRKNSKALLDLLINPTPASIAPVLELIAKRPEAIEDLFKILKDLSRTLDTAQFKACIDSVVNTLDLDLGVETSPIAPILKMVLSRLPELLTSNQEDVLALLRASSMSPFPKTLEEIVEHPELVKPLFNILKTLSERLGTDELKEILVALRESFDLPVDPNSAGSFLTLFKMLSSKLPNMLETDYASSVSVLLQVFKAQNPRTIAVALSKILANLTPEELYLQSGHVLEILQGINQAYYVLLRNIFSQMQLKHFTAIQPLLIPLLPLVAAENVSLKSLFRPLVGLRTGIAAASMSMIVPGVRWLLSRVNLAEEPTNAEFALSADLQALAKRVIEQIKAGGSLSIRELGDDEEIKDYTVQLERAFFNTEDEDIPLVQEVMGFIEGEKDLLLQALNLP